MTTTCVHCNSPTSDRIEAPGDHQGMLVPYSFACCSSECLKAETASRDWPIRPYDDTPSFTVFQPWLLNEPLNPTAERDRTLLMDTITRLLTDQTGMFTNRNALEIVTEDDTMAAVITRRRDGDTSALQANYRYTVTTFDAPDAIDEQHGAVQNPRDALTTFLDNCSEPVTLSINSEPTPSRQPDHPCHA